MFIGPVFAREVAIVPRQGKTYVGRSVYGLALVVLISTAWLLLTGTHWIRDLGDFSRFGATLFQVLAPLQLALSAFFAAVLTAGAVAQEKDRKTLVLLLMTNLSNQEIVLGKLAAGILNVVLLLFVALPIFMLCTLFGGVSVAQVVRVFLVTLITVVAAGSLGSLIALWREKTFQALAVTVLTLVLWVAFWEAVGQGLLGREILGLQCNSLAAAMSPWTAVRVATAPVVAADPLSASVHGVGPFLFMAALLSTIMNNVAIARVRAWNAVGQARPEEETATETIAEAVLTETGETTAEPLGKETHWDVHQETEGTVEEAASAPAVSAELQATRHVWDNPILWREVRTRAYGRKTLIIRLIYLVLFGFAAYACHFAVTAPTAYIDPVTIAAPIVPLLLLSLVLVNAQAVTSLTSERDGKAIDLLLVSDLTSKEFVYGKLGGVFWNAKEMVILPIALCVYIWAMGAMSSFNLFYLLIGLAVLYAFVAMVGVHTGMHYSNTRSAVGTSLGTVFFLFMGIATCMWMMVAFSGSFQAQLQPFLAFMLGGGLGLYFGLGARNPSRAIGLASFLCPLATFYAVTSMLLGQPHYVFIATVGAYGFATVAMLIPAIDEFDVATGRTTAHE